MIKKIGMAILKETMIQFVLSAVLLAAAAFIVLKMSPSESVIKGMILAIYGIASFVGGNILGKVMGKRRLLWGIAAGMIYIAVIILVAIGVKGSVNAGTIGLLSSVLVCIVAGAIGGVA